MIPPFGGGKSTKNSLQNTMFKRKLLSENNTNGSKHLLGHPGMLVHCIDFHLKSDIALLRNMALH